MVYGLETVTYMCVAHFDYKCENICYLALVAIMVQAACWILSNSNSHFLSVTTSWTGKIRMLWNFSLRLPCLEDRWTHLSNGEKISVSYRTSLSSCFCGSIFKKKEKHLLNDPCVHVVSLCLCLSAYMYSASLYHLPDI